MSGTTKLYVLATIGLVACADDLSSEDQEVKIAEELKELRQSTAQYHELQHALDDGFAFGINGAFMTCVANANPAIGAMGYHYGNQARFSDPTIDELEPEVLVYHTGADGALALGAVEWVVPRPVWEAVHGIGAPPPSVYGTDLVVLNPVANLYVAHAWVWKENPSGVLSNWNPAVTCP